MRASQGALFTVLLLSPAALGLQTTIGLQFEDGSHAKSLSQFVFNGSQDGLTVTLATDGDLNGIQYAIFAAADPDGPGPAPAVDASHLFQFTHSINLSGKGANPFTGPSRLHAYEDGGVFDAAFSDPDLFHTGDYTIGYGPAAIAPTPLPVPFAAASPDIIFRTSGTTLATALDPDHDKVVTYHFQAGGPLPIANYRFYIGNRAGLGFKACGPDGCVDALSGTVAELYVPEPAAGWLALAALPLIRRQRRS